LLPANHSNSMKSKTISFLTVGTAALLALNLCGPAAAAEEAKPNTLTTEEKAAGWQLLFNGTNFDGWHNYHRTGMSPGWVIEDGAMVDKQHGGDIVTSDEYSWFELQLDYKASAECNSGIMYHVNTSGPAIWSTGPEFQLEDNATADDPVRSGWLYALYQPPNDPATGKPLDATHRTDQWNHVRLLVTPEKCEHDINGVKYFEYVLHSDDFNNRLARSKFARMPGFAKSDVGFIGLQGDHPGAVAFRNIKIRPILAK